MTPPKEEFPPRLVVEWELTPMIARRPLGHRGLGNYISLIEHRALLSQAQRERDEFRKLLEMVDCRSADVFSENGKCLKCDLLAKYAAPKDGGGT